MDYKKIIRQVPNFPKKGINFIDLTTLWKNPQALKECINEFVERYKSKMINKVVAVESRGFIIGAPLAYMIGAGFVPARKKGKLPAEKLSQNYSLEYGEETIEIHKDSIENGENIIIVDDLLATGGTVNAVCNLVEKLGGNIIECAFIVELDFLKGREKIKYPVFTIIHYENE